MELDRDHHGSSLGGGIRDVALPLAPLRRVCKRDLYLYILHRGQRDRGAFSFGGGNFLRANAEKRLTKKKKRIMIDGNRRYFQRYDQDRAG